MKFEGFGLTDLRDELDIADVVMEQRSARCLLRVRGGGAGPAAALQVDLNKRTPRPKPLSERQRLPLVRLVYRTQVAANSASGRFISGSELQPVRSLCPSYYHVQGLRAGTKEDGNMQRSMTRIRTSHVGRLPPPKGWEDMPARLASAEIMNPAVIVAQVTPAIAETVRRQVEIGIDCIGDGEAVRRGRDHSNV